MTRPDSRHDLDAVSLGAGLVAVLVAALYLVGELTAVEVSGGVVAAVLVGAVGALGLLAGLRRLQRQTPAPAPPDDSP